MKVLLKSILIGLILGPLMLGAAVHRDSSDWVVDVETSQDNPHKNIVLTPLIPEDEAKREGFRSQR